MNNLLVDSLITGWLRTQNIERPFHHRTAPQMTMVDGVLNVVVDIEIDGIAVNGTFPADKYAAQKIEFYL